MIDPPPPKLRVAIVSTSFPLAKGSTSGVFVEELAKHLAQHADVTVVTPASTTSPDISGDSGIQLIPFAYAPRAWQVLAHSPGGLPTALRQNPFLTILVPGLLISMLFACLRIAGSVDVFHANWSLNGLIAGIAGRLRGKPVVTTLRGSDVSMLDHRVLKRWTLRAAARVSDRIVAVGDSIRRRAQEVVGNRTDVDTIHNGVASKFLEIPAPVLENPPVITVSGVGNLVPEKGFDTLIRAVAKLTTPKAIQVRIIGNGPMREQLETLASSLGIGGSIYFAGNLPACAMPNAYAATDIFVHTSFTEGRSNVVVEALAAGKATIATRIDGVSELIQHGENGLLYDAGDVNALAHHLEALRSNSALRARLGANGRAFVLREGLTWDITARRYLDLFCDVVDSKSPRTS